MKPRRATPEHAQIPCQPSCQQVQAEFSAYLDGAVSGVRMAAIVSHLHSCAGCSTEFAAWRSMQDTLSNLRPVQAPRSLQRQLREAISFERRRGSHLSTLRRLKAQWTLVAPAAFRFAGGLVAALVIVAGIVAVFSAPLAVQANDDDMAHLVSPYYLYSQVPPRPVEMRHDTPILVEAKIDARGRVYDYAIVEGPDNANVRLRIEENLLASVFQPATVFGVPVRGQVMLTYSSVSVRG